MLETTTEADARSEGAEPPSEPSEHLTHKALSMRDEREDVPHQCHPLHHHEDEDQKSTTDESAREDSHQGQGHGGEERQESEAPLLGHDFLDLLRRTGEEEGGAQHRKISKCVHGCELFWMTEHHTAEEEPTSRL